MRIISGKYKKRNLFTVPGRSTRPTTSYNREVLFSTYQEYEGKQVLDLFAGTGSFGLEALSRGAAWVDFVEFASPAIAILIANIKLLGCGEDCHIYRKKVHAFLKDCPKQYDVIFMDPPYDKNLINPSLEAIFAGGILNDGGVIVVEHSAAEKIADKYQDRVLKHKPGKTASFSWLTCN
jgi:16S rRNA (guanine966-N2)-methyltransferase